MPYTKAEHCFIWFRIISLDREQLSGSGPQKGLSEPLLLRSLPNWDWQGLNPGLSKCWEEAVALSWCSCLDLLSSALDCANPGWSSCSSHLTFQRHGRPPRRVAREQRRENARPFLCFFPRNGTDGRRAAGGDYQGEP